MSGTVCTSSAVWCWITEMSNFLSICLSDSFISRGFHCKIQMLKSFLLFLGEKEKGKYRKLVLSIPSEWTPCCVWAVVLKNKNRTLHLFRELEGGGRFPRWWGWCPGCAWRWSGLWRQSCPCASCRAARSTPWTLRQKDWERERGLFVLLLLLFLTTQPPAHPTPPVRLQQHWKIKSIRTFRKDTYKWNGRNENVQQWRLQTGNVVSCCLFTPNVLMEKKNEQIASGVNDWQVWDDVHLPLILTGVKNFACEENILTDRREH